MAAPITLPIIRPTLPSFDEVEPLFREIWGSGLLTVGVHNRALEAEVTARTGAAHAVAVANCTSGLMLMLRALDLPPGSEVVVPSFTFAATAHAVVWNGLRPVFADCDAQTLTLDPAAAARCVSPRTSAIMATTIFGTPPDIDALEALATRHAIPLVLDSAQALGSTWRGRAMGGFGRGEVFSWSPTKVATAAEAGVITTQDAALASRLRQLRDYGKGADGQDMEFIGLSARLSEFHAAVGRVTLRHLDEYIAHRGRAMQWYREALLGLPGLSTPLLPAHATSSNNYFVVRLSKDAPLSRDALYAVLSAAGIQCKRYFWPAVHLQTAYAPEHAGTDAPNAEAASAECLALPLYGHISEEQVGQVVAATRSAFAAA